MAKPLSLVLAVILLMLFLGGCNPGAPAGNPAAGYTIAAMTIDAAQAAAATYTPSLLFTSSPPPQMMPSDTPSDTPFAIATFPVVANSYPCDDSAYVSDVTIPDGTVVAPDDSFTKTWSFQNTGTCDWTASYAIASVSGDAMGGSATALSNAVSAGGEVNVSVNMTAPETAGTYIGYWRLQNDEGTFFGEAVYVQIVVSDSTATITPTPTATASLGAAAMTSTPTAIVAAPTNTPTPTSIPVSTLTATEEPTDTTLPATPTPTTAS